MKTRLLRGAVFILLGLVASLGIATVFHVCPAMKDMVMKCYWTGRVSIAVGIGILCKEESLCRRTVCGGDPVGD